MINFICGCRSKIDPPITEGIFSTFDSVVYDTEGFIMCQIHHARRIGWLSVPYTTMTRPYVPREILTAEEIAVCEKKKIWPQYDTCNWSPLEYERWVIFGEFPKTKTVNFQSSAPDHRDARDPQEIGEGLKIGYRGAGPMTQKIHTASFPGAPLLNERGENLLDAMDREGETRPFGHIHEPRQLLEYQRQLAMDSLRA